jgi:hypothetical protein
MKFELINKPVKTACPYCKKEISTKALRCKWCGGWIKKREIMKYLLKLLPLFILLFSGCIDKDEYITIDNKTDYTESEVSGLYLGGGMYKDIGSSLQLHQGGSFLMKKGFFPDTGPVYGNWQLKNGEIKFFIDGQSIFSARVAEETGGKAGKGRRRVTGIIYNNQLWDKVN